jgi:preprotein translocase subunit YajC
VNRAKFRAGDRVVAENGMHGTVQTVLEATYRYRVKFGNGIVHPSQVIDVDEKRLTRAREPR